MPNNQTEASLSKPTSLKVNTQSETAFTQALNKLNEATVGAYKLAQKQYAADKDTAAFKAVVKELSVQYTVDVERLYNLCMVEMRKREAAKNEYRLNMQMYKVKEANIQLQVEAAKAEAAKKEAEFSSIHAQAMAEAAKKEAEIQAEVQAETQADKALDDYIQAILKSKEA